MNRLLRFDGRVAVITGAGGGLGKAYALLLAERGASVLVNDLGGSSKGEGSDSRAADKVVHEIKEKGGIAVPNYDSVTNGDRIIKSAVDTFGKIDILINNAGILRDKTFAKMTDVDWELIQQVHLEGAYKTTRAAWDYFRNQNYGRVVMTSSTSGLFGNFGQANYAAAKSGLVGFAQTLAKEGVKFNIHTNTIVPMAGSRMTEYILPPDLHAALKPELIAPVVAWMVHEECPDNGSIIESAGGVATKYQWFRGAGALLRARLNENVTMESVREKWDDVTDMDLEKGSMPTTAEEMAGIILKSMEQMTDNEDGSSSVPESEVTRSNLPNYKVPDTYFKYKVKDAILYALGVGTGLNDPAALNYLYENSEDFRVLPTFPVVAGHDAMYNVMKIPGLNIDPTQILHGEQYVELLRPLSPQANLRIKTKIVDVMDKISGAVYIYRMEGEDEDGPVFVMEYSIFEVGAGKFGGPRDTKKPISRPVVPPKRNPDKVLEFVTRPDQAALYRLSGDWNPLHIDPNFSALAGFSRPIIHGLCSYGIAARLILGEYGNSDPKTFKAIKCRFAKPIYPGQTLQIQTWVEGNRVHFEVKVKETGDIALSGGYVDFSQAPLKNPQSKL